MTQDIISAYLIICDFKEIAKKRKLDHRKNYQIYGYIIHLHCTNVVNIHEYLHFPLSFSVITLRTGFVPYSPIH